MFQPGRSSGACVAVFRFAAALSMFAGGGAAAQSVDNVAIAPEVVLEDRYPDREHRFANGVTSYADVVYSVPPGFRPLTLDLYLPEGAGSDDARYPLLVMIHGGGWMAGHTRHSGAFANWPEALAAIADEGFVVASVEYRLSGEAPFPAAFDDVQNAIRWVRSHADEYGVDRSRALAMGGSAGGQLAGLVGTACGDKRNPDEADDESAESACVQGVVTWYGVFDFAKIVPMGEAGEGQTVSGAPGRYLGCSETACDPDVVRAASAIYFVDRNDPPFLMIHGTVDPVVSIEQSRAMQNALESAGVDSTLIEIPGVKHSFIGETPEATINASRRAWDASIAFIRRVMGDT